MLERASPVSMPPRRQLIATVTCLLPVVAFVVLRVMFKNVLPAILIDRLMGFGLLVTGPIGIAAAAFAPAERRWTISIGLIAMLTGLTLWWLERPDRLWVVPAVLAASLWMLSLRAAVRAVRNESAPH